MIKKFQISLKNLFRSKSQDTVDDLADHENNVDTKELDKATTPVDTKKVGYSSPLINVGYGLSPGKQRNHNEDARHCQSIIAVVLRYC